MKTLRATAGTQRNDGTIDLCPILISIAGLPFIVLLKKLILTKSIETFKQEGMMRDCKRPLERNRCGIIYFMLLFLAVIIPQDQEAQAAPLWNGIHQSQAGPLTGASGCAGSIPTNRTQCGSLIQAYTGDASQINAAIANCGANQLVLLGVGTFYLSAGINFNGKSN